MSYLRLLFPVIVVFLGRASPHAPPPRDQAYEFKLTSPNVIVDTKSFSAGNRFLKSHDAEIRKPIDVPDTAERVNTCTTALSVVNDLVYKMTKTSPVVGKLKSIITVQKGFFKFYLLEWVQQNCRSSCFGSNTWPP
ncbi:uncharacterized protein PITG_17676 [Phytophthora infestans T30-4]|uniref:Secreted RxLR effector peptide protein n=1 Tax=Phytophthora infestans (strain T30-4) TaxID=403677 RepID=D0NWL3_PHYIT|nr:uncharacterized protein PITG_17676 [Phytophthora infestans T30-4]EEY67076.1 hypothetical protein PITG_17676 [Phytophthora infestans T30-4]|eukprot:XP_002896528.1 hypothetical protein PITG_17676 [Phytophthora infestans T30-4]